MIPDRSHGRECTGAFITLTWKSEKYLKSMINNEKAAT